MQRDPRLCHRDKSRPGLEAPRFRLLMAGQEKKESGFGLAQQVEGKKGVGWQIRLLSP